MQIKTSRFGPLQIEPEDILLFPFGLFAFEDKRHWVLLADADNEAVGWLQCVSDPDIAMAVVSPRRFQPEYKIRVGRSQLAALQMNQDDQAFVLTIVSKTGPQLTLNLKAPLVINLDRRLGRQVITSDEQPVQHPIGTTPIAYRKTA